ncbi:hypothetical protein [Campylobacter sp.]|uniref:hypothetical protein n=1 Tax=Campylobacter sp. TaxID=205 RepID=UPI002A74E7E5|nr:hypothetical protein [Campylobacter sp.]MDY3245382.1 hypothetical protein [Campylobacter sp.]
MNKIIALNSGSSFHINSLTKGILSKELYKIPYLKELCKNDVKDADILWVSCTSPVDLLIEKKRIFIDYLQDGKTLVVTGRNDPHLWLEGIEEVQLPFNFWWWLDKNEQIDALKDDENAKIFNYIDFKDMLWHFHNGYKKLPNSSSAIKYKYDDKISIFQEASYMGGKLILSSLDPLFHHGSFFMPNATKLAIAMIKYLKDLK